MKSSLYKTTLITLTLLLSTSLASAADTKAAAAPQPAASKAAAPQPAASKASTSSKTAKPEVDAKRKAAAKVKLVNINGASKEELKALPNISDADADKIIAGRPYGSKAHLLTRKVVDAGVYEGIRGLVIATQPTKDAAQNAALQTKKK